MITPDDLHHAGRLLTAADWIYAKTMPENPHEYTLRRRWADEEDFASVVRIMRRHGYTEHFKGRPYTMLNVNGQKHWTMGAPVPITILINRKPVSPPAYYDPIAPAYDDAFRDPISRAQDRAVMDLLGDLRGLNVLDVGCGTGLLLDYADPGAYTGIDPSGAMLDRLREKHPDRAGHVIQCPLEEFYGAGYDLVTCLFGSPAYIDSSHLAAIPRLLRPGGRYVLMFLAPDYTPLTHERTGGHAPPFTSGVHVDLPGTRTTLDTFIIVDGRAP